MPAARSPTNQSPTSISRGAGGYVIAPWLHHAGRAPLPHPRIDAEPDSIPARMAGRSSCRQARGPQSPSTSPFTAEPVSDYRKASYGQMAMEEIERELASVPKMAHSQQPGRPPVLQGRAARSRRLHGRGRGLQRAAFRQCGPVLGHPPQRQGPRPAACTIARAIKAGMGTPRGPSTMTLPTSRSCLGNQTTTPETGGDHRAQVRGIYTVGPGLSPPGLVGEISEYINNTAIYPQPALALGAALCIVGTSAGRHMAQALYQRQGRTSTWSAWPRPDPERGPPPGP